MIDFPKLFIPGPTHVSKEILDVFSTKQIGHRTPEISVLIDEIIYGIKKVLYTNNDIYLDCWIDYLGKVPAKKQPPLLRWLLHLGLYQVLKMVKIYQFV